MGTEKTLGRWFVRADAPVPPPVVDLPVVYNAKPALCPHCHQPNQVYTSHDMYGPYLACTCGFMADYAPPPVDTPTI